MPSRQPKGPHKSRSVNCLSLLKSNVKKMVDLGNFFKNGCIKKPNKQPIVFHIAFATLLNTDHLVTTACEQLMNGNFYCSVQCTQITGLCLDENGTEQGIFIALEVYVL